MGSLRGAGDAQLRGDVGDVSEIRIGDTDVPAERQSAAIVEAAAEAVAPAGGGA